MADKIGKPLPRGVVDVQREFVGVQSQEMNHIKEIARLRKQVGRLRTKIDASGAAFRNSTWRIGSEGTVTTLATAAIVGAIIFGLVTWRTRHR